MPTGDARRLFGMMLFWGLGVAVACGGEGADGVDLFSLDGRPSIMAEGHLGVVNGRLTVGIPFGRVGRLDGLWAPPYVSSDFHLALTVSGKEVPTEHYRWWPFRVERHATADGIDVAEATVLAQDRRAGLVSVTLKNPTAATRRVPVGFNVKATLDRSSVWEFGAPRSSTATRPGEEAGAMVLKSADMAAVLRAADGELTWNATDGSGRQVVVLERNGQDTLYLAFAVGPAAEAKSACEVIAADPRKAIRDAQNSHRRQIEDLFQKLPRLRSSNAALERFYERSLVHLLMNRWDVPEFVLHPYYSTGSVRGGCVCDYLWNFGEIWEIMPLYDPAALRQHIKQFLKTDITRHFAFNPMDGKAFGPWYMVNQEKIIGLIYYYVKNTGDAGFLNEAVDGRTVLDHVLANAVHRDDLSKPVELVDYGPSNSHLELRRQYAYHHVMPDLNGRRYANYLMAERLAAVAGKPAPHLRQRADALKAVLKRQMWNPRTRWFDFRNGKGDHETRYTVQMFKLFGSGVLDEEEESGLLGHLNEREFLSEFGLHSLSKTDPAYDESDVDNGGPGACTCFPPQIAERLYKAGRAREAADILRRSLWWGQRMPYWGDSLVADRVDYRRDTPLQCTIDGVCVAQCILFGMFGVDAQWDRRILVSPSAPAFAREMELRGVKLRGVVFDVAVGGSEFRVSSGGMRLVARVGQTVVVEPGGSVALAPPGVRRGF